MPIRTLPPFLIKSPRKPITLEELHKQRLNELMEKVRTQPGRPITAENMRGIRNTENAIAKLKKMKEKELAEQEKTAVEALLNFQREPVYAKKTRKSRRTNIIPNNAVVNVQQDPYSARFLTNKVTAKKILNDAGPTYLGGRGNKRRTRRRV